MGEVRDPMPPAGGLSAASARAVLWNAGQKWVLRIGGFVTVAILARLLSPTDFGLVALAMTVIPFLYLLTDLGFTAYLVQAESLDQRQLSTAFWYSAVAGAVLALLMVAAAPWAAALLDTPDVAPVLASVAPAALIVGLGSVPIALLRRQLRFRALSIQATIGGVLAQICALVLAFLGYGVYALVVQLLVAQFVAALLAWTSCRWAPGFRFSVHEFQIMARFGLKVASVDLVAIARSWLEAWIITLSLGVTGLGYLNIAQRLIQVSQDLSASAMTPVSMVVFAKVRSEPARLVSSYLRSQSVSFAIVLPVMAFIAVAAPALIPLIFGAGWEPSIVPAQFLALAAVLTLGAALDQGLFIGAGRPGRWLGYAIVVDALTVAVTAVTAHAGLVAIAAGFLVVCVLATLLRWVLLSRLLGAKVRQVASPMMRTLPAGAVSSALALLAMWLAAPLPPLAQAIVAGCVLAISYLAAVRLTNPAVYREVVRLIGELARRPRRGGGSAPVDRERR